MANAKYDNLIPLLAAGRLNWPADSIQGVLLEGAVFDATDTRLSDVTGSTRGWATLPERSVGPDGSFLGFPVSFAVLADVTYALAVVKDDGKNDPLMLIFYDRNDADAVLKLTTAGTMTLRPAGATSTTPGTWLEF